MLAFYCPFQVAHHTAVDVAALDADKHGLEYAVPVGKRDHTVDAPVGTLLLLAAYRLRIHECKRPELELITPARALCELASTFDFGRLAQDLHGLHTEAVFQSGFHHSDCQVGDVNADPTAGQLLCGDERCATTAERIQNNV